MNTEPTQAVWIPGTVVFGPVLPPGHPDLETSGEGGESKQGGLADAPPPPRTFTSNPPPADHAPCCSCSLCTTPTIAALNAHQTLAETRGGGANATWAAYGESCRSRASDRTGKAGKGVSSSPDIGALASCCVAPAACGESCRSRASDRSASSSPDIGTLTALDDDTCGCILAFLLPAFHTERDLVGDEIETLRAACRGGRALVGRTLLPPSAHGTNDAFPQSLAHAFPRLFAAGRPPLTIAESLALYRGLRQKAIMMALVTELQVDDPGWRGRPRRLVSLKDWNGVTLEEDFGRVEAIDFSERCSGGNMRRLVLPDGIKSLDLHGCAKLKGPIHKLALPEGMQDLNLSYCPKVSGEL